MIIEFMPAGGGEEIGANSYYLNIDNTGFILDCGTHPQKQGIESLPDFTLLENKELDYIIVSHAHQDHSDALPYYITRFPYLKIIATPQTKDILERTLHTSVEIMKTEVTDEEFKIFSHQEIDLLMSTVAVQRYDETAQLYGYKQVSNYPVEMSLYDAGHILGSASVLLEHRGAKVFYTGDINLSHQSLTPAATLPDTEVDILITECTYGATESTTLNSWEVESERLIKSINAVLSGGGSVLIPVFALGKLQEISTIIWKAVLDGKLPKVPLFAGGMGMKLNYLYDKHRYNSSLRDTEFLLGKISYSNLFDLPGSDALFRTPTIVLATSGMVMPGTASFNLANEFIRREDCAVFTVGYMDSSTPGYVLSNAGRGDTISLDEGYTYKEVKCDIKKFRFSAHAKREEILHIADVLNPKHIILVHGDTAAVDYIGAELLKKNKNRKVYAACCGKSLKIEL